MPDAVQSERIPLRGLTEVVMPNIPSSHCGRFEQIVNRRQFLQRGSGLRRRGARALAGVARIARRGNNRPESPGAAGGTFPPRPSPSFGSSWKAPQRRRYVRSQTRTHEAERADDQDRRLQRQSRPADEVAFPLPAARRKRRLGLREVSARRPARGQVCVYQIATQRVQRSRPGALSNQHRHRPPRFSGGRGMGHLRPGKRESEPARLRGAGQQPGHQRRTAQLARGFPALDVSGDAVST